MGRLIEEVGKHWKMPELKEIRVHKGGNCSCCVTLWVFSRVGTEREEGGG